MFLIQTIEIILSQGAPLVDVAAADGTDVNELYNILRQGALQLSIGSKSYLTQAPLMTMPLANTLNAEFAIATTATTDVAESSYLAAQGPCLYPFCVDQIARQAYQW